MSLRRRAQGGAIRSSLISSKSVEMVRRMDSACSSSHASAIFWLISTSKAARMSEIAALFITYLAMFSLGWFMGGGGRR